MDIKEIVNEELDLKELNKKLAAINASNKKLTDVMNQNSAVAPTLSKEIGNINLTLASLQQDINKYSKEKVEAQKSGVGTQVAVAKPAVPASTIKQPTLPTTEAKPAASNTKPV